MVDAIGFRRVEATKNLAKRLGFGLDTTGVLSNRIIVYGERSLALEMFGDKTFADFPTIDEVHAFLKGWESFQKKMKDIEFDLSEYKKRKADAEILKKLKTKPRKK